MKPRIEDVEREITTWALDINLSNFSLSNRNEQTNENLTGSVKRKKHRSN